MKIHIPEQTFDIDETGYGRIKFDLSVANTNETIMSEETIVTPAVEEVTPVAEVPTEAPQESEVPVEVAPEVVPEVTPEVAPEAPAAEVAA